MVKAYFISDVHLDFFLTDAEQKKRAVFKAFLETIKQEATHLFIVGDLFDFWFEYRYVIPKAFFPFLRLFSELKDAGITLHYLAGNHDFQMGPFFSDVLQMETHLNSYACTLAGKRFYLYHGDGIGPGTGMYRVMKKIFRFPLNQKLFRWLHPDWGIPLARYLSGASRQHTNQNNHLRDESAYKKFAEERFAEGFDYVLMGHRHNPLVHRVGDKQYINLGDWISYHTLACFDGRHLEFLTFKPGDGFAPFTKK
ncbi:MAG: UDP-2,3-diacylglucosamine diphosphatase [Calditrichaeota bacterium]|nr:MAG: UDP-2,3-diacylglucosamine diphosphatase [Calditrichota bacterium]